MKITEGPLTAISGWPRCMKVKRAYNSRNRHLPEWRFLGLSCKHSFEPGRRMPWCPCCFIIAVYLDLSSSRGGGFFCGLSLPLQGRWHAERDGEVVTNLRQPLSLLRRQLPWKGSLFLRPAGAAAGRGGAGTKKRPPEGPLLSA